MTVRRYAGIGSQETPYQILDKMLQRARALADADYVLRTGWAGGADRAFMSGADRTEIFTADDVANDSPWLAHASLFHPAWEACNPYARRTLARNSAIILGADLCTPVEFVLCWTKGGAVIGGTGQALRIAMAYGIPIENMGLE